MYRLLYFLPFLFLSILGYGMYYSLYLNPDDLETPLIDHHMPSFAVPSLFDKNEIITNDSLKGQFFVLNVWATWCSSCMYEHDFLLDLKKQGIKIVGLNYKEKNSIAPISSLVKHGNPFSKVLFDKEGQLALDLGVFGVPETYLIDSKGNIVYKYVGVITREVWVKNFTHLIDEID